MLAGQAFKGSLVMVGLFGWLNVRKKHWHPAQNAQRRKIARPRWIIEMRFAHASLPYQYRREHPLSLSHRRLAEPQSMMFPLDVQSTNKSIREGLKRSSTREGLKDPQRC
jgi:hypothetical protein